MNLPKNAELWAGDYLRGRLERRLDAREPKRLWVALTDHYEPMGGGVSLEHGLRRVAAWQEHWPAMAQKAPRDVDGKPPRLTFFYPQEEYRREVLAALEALCRTGLADVEVHLHHDHDTAEGFRGKVSDFCRRLHEEHGLLRVVDGRIAFGFIHGNWALDNARPDRRWCGVKGELQVLRDLGCYADFTMPSLPSPTQSRKVNRIYWTTGSPDRPRGFDRGVDATVGGGVRGDLLMVTGPTGLRSRDRWVPRLETGELAHYDLPTADRVERWLDLAPRIGGDVFVKLYGHSAREDNAAALLGPDGLAPMFRWIAEAAERHELELHWVTAYEMFRAIRGLLEGETR